MKEQTETRIYKFPCYETKTGIRIGSMYVPPQRNLMSREDYFWQRRLLKPGRSVMPRGINREQIDEIIAAVSAIAMLATIAIVWLT